MIQRSFEKHRLLCLVMAVVLTFTMTCAAVLTANALEPTQHTSGDYTYTLLDDGTAEITGCTNITTDLTIPSTLGGITVTSIGENAFEDNGTLVNLVIPEGVKNVGQNAFAGNIFEDENKSVLTSVKLPESLETIGNYAFRSNYKLSSINFPASLTSIGDNAFGMCDSLTSVNLHRGVSLKKNVFQDCKSLTSVTLPSDLTSVPDSTFFGCSALTSIDIPVGVKKIDQNAFGHCTSLESVVIPEGVELIMNGAFYNCGLTSVTIPSTVKEIKMGAFKNCMSLMEVTVPPTVTTIGDLAFGYWWNGDPQVWKDLLIEGFVLKGYDGTAADAYCKQYGVAYESLGEAKTLKVTLASQQMDGYIELSATTKYGEAPVKLSYSANGTPIEGSSSSIHWTPSADGEYVIICTATDAAGATASDSVTLYIKNGVIGEPDPLEFYTVYFDNSTKNFATPYCYYWPKGGRGSVDWPGKPMELVSGNIYKFTFPAENNMCIFNGNGSGQTGNLELPGNNYLYDGSKWSDTPYITPVDPPTTVSPTTATQPITTQPATSQPSTTQPATTQPATEPSNRILIGDVDLNGTITVSDSTEVQRYIVHISTLSDEAIIAADVNKDSVISVKDATMIQAYIVKLIVEDSYCGTYTENVAPTQPTTNVTEPTTEPTSIQTKNYVYFNNTENWSTVNVYVWSSKDSTYMSWPGTAMESIGNNTYRFELPNGAEYAIFNNGSTKTDDLKIPDVNMIYSNGQWSKYSE